MSSLDLLAIASDRELRLEAHRVLRCIEDQLCFTEYAPVDTRQVAELLAMHPQAVSRAMRILCERGIIDRGPSRGRWSTFRFTTMVMKPTVREDQLELRTAEESDLDALVRGAGVSASYGRDDLRRDVASGRCWLLRIDGLLVGQLAIRKDPSIEMSYLFARMMIDRRYRRMGFGRRLVQRMERALDGNRIHAYSPISDSQYVQFLVRVGFTLSGYLKGPREKDTRLFFGKIAQAAAELEVQRQFDAAT